MTITNPITEAQGFVADFLSGEAEYDPECDPNVELDRGSRIMKALLDEHRAHVAYLEMQARRAFEDTRMWEDAEIDAFLRWPQ